jgi:hypothetical protein
MRVYSQILGMVLLLLPRNGSIAGSQQQRNRSDEPCLRSSLSLRKGWRFPVERPPVSHVGAALNFYKLAVTRGRCGRETGLPTRFSAAAKDFVTFGGAS